MWNWIKSLFVREPVQQMPPYRVVKGVNGNGKDVWLVQKNFFGQWIDHCRDTYGGPKREVFYRVQDALDCMSLLMHDDKEKDIQITKVVV